MSNVYKSEAIVFRKMKYSETSIIVDLFTLDHGVRSFIVNGVRSTRGKNKSAYFQYNQILNIVAYDKKDNLSRLKEYTFGHTYDHLMTDVIKSSIGVFLLEINKNVIKEQSPSPELYHFVKKWLLELDELPTAQLANVPSVYIIELCHYLGIFPMNNQTKDAMFFNKKEGIFEAEYNDDTMGLDLSQILGILMSSSHEQALQLKISKNHRDSLLDELIEYLKIQLPNTIDIRSLDILRAIF